MPLSGIAMIAMHNKDAAHQPQPRAGGPAAGKTPLATVKPLCYRGIANN
jgi:hypothetical protein